MKFQDVLNEKYKTAFKHGHGDSVLEVWESPFSSNDMRDLKKLTGIIRVGVIDGPSPKMMMWDGRVMVHDPMAKKLKVKWDFGFVYYVKDGTVVSDWGYEWKHNIKDQDKILKMIKKGFPKVKEIPMWNKKTDVDTVVKL